MHAWPRTHTQRESGQILSLNFLPYSFHFYRFSLTCTHIYCVWPIHKSLLSLHACWQRRAMGQIAHYVSLSEGCRPPSIMVYIHMNTQTQGKGTDREVRRALWDTAYLSVWAACPSLGQIDGWVKQGGVRGAWPEDTGQSPEMRAWRERELHFP